MPHIFPCAPVMEVFSSAYISRGSNTPFGRQDGSAKAPLLSVLPGPTLGSHVALVAWAEEGGALLLSATPFSDGGVPRSNASLIVLNVSADLGGAQEAASLAVLQVGRWIAAIRQGHACFGMSVDGSTSVDGAAYR